MFRLITLLVAVLYATDFFSVHAIAKNVPLFRDVEAPLKARVDDLIGRLALEEKASQIVMDSPAIKRLGIPAYHWWNECIHGVARAGKATQFPVSVALAASWDPELIHLMSSAVGDEMRAKHEHGKDSRQYQGLTCWAPTVNMARDPRWGRIEETYGEDPYLTSRMAVAFITGLQGDDPRYLKVAATPKHFAVYNEEVNREGKDVRVSERAMRDYYLPAFKDSVMAGRAASLMTSYNGVNGVPSTINMWLITDILRKEWGFDGVVVPDVSAPSHVKDRHRKANSYPEVAARFIKAGGSLIADKQEWQDHLLTAVERGLLTEQDLVNPLSEVLTLRFRLGQFDPPEAVHYTHIPKTVVGSSEHLQLAIRAAREGIILLQNNPVNAADSSTRLLPLNRKKIHSIAMIGPYADVIQLGAYSGEPASVAVTPFTGILKKAGPSIKVHLVPWEREGKEQRKVGELREDELKSIRESDVVIAVLGLDSRYEREGIDRNDLRLPPEQNAFLRWAYSQNRRLVVVLENGGPVSDIWMKENVLAVVELWYPGEQGGAALADVLFGDYNPAGRLPLTMYLSEKQLPPMGNYEVMEGRTYQYLRSEPLYPFGYGLSYTTFEYSGLTIDSQAVGAGNKIWVNLEVKNTGKWDGDEVIQLYVRNTEADRSQPLMRLKGFRRVFLAQGETKSIDFTLAGDDLSSWDEKKKGFTVRPGRYEIMIGASSSDIRLRGSVLVGG